MVYVRKGGNWVGGGSSIPDELTDLDTTVTGSELDALKLKVDGIEEGADVTDATNVAAAGAFMKSSDDLDDISEGTTNKHFTSALASKLDGIEEGADVTDATNVDAAGAVMNSDTSTSAMQFVVDEDNMASNSATKVPTQQSVKAYADAGYRPGGTDVALADGGTGASLSDPGGDRILFWDDSGNAVTWLAPDGTNLTISGTTLDIGSGVYRSGGTDVALADGGTGASLTDPNADRIMFWDDSAGAVTWLAPGTNISISGTTIDVGSAVYRSGGTDVALADGGTGASLTDPNADRIMFWDDSAGAVTWLAPNTGLAISGTNLNAEVSASSANTFTNKRVTKRVATVTSNATPTLNTDNCDAFTMTLSTTITSFSTNLSGTPTDFQQLLGRITASGGDRGITLGSAWNDVGGDFPDTIPSGKTLYIGATYNSGTSKWDILAWKVSA